MMPTPQEHMSTPEDHVTTKPSEDLTLDGEKIVISGISGLYPQSHNVKELSDILYNKENPVTAEGLRWNFKHSDLANYSGMAPELERFDAQFFTVHYRLGHYMDPMSRKILEQTYQAIYDAGLSPSQFNGKKVAVFIGTSFSESEKHGFFDIVSKSGLGILGSSKTMLANRISYWLNTKGPSLAVDEADCSSTTALEEAYKALKRGECEAAIVGGANICLLPHASIHHGRLAATVAKDGTTKSFAKDSDGYILSDTISVLLLQKAKHALRIYSELLHVKNEFVSLITDATGPKHGYCRNPETTAEFIKQFYKEAQVAPQAVEYVEAYGTGIPDADKSELEAIAEVYCEDRDDSLLVGSVTSNIGLTVAAAGMSGITKVLLGYHTGQLAANLHCSSPRQDVAALREGRMRVVTDHQPFRRTYVAVNGMSVTGVNSHVLLHGHYKHKDLSRYKSSIPRLVTVSGRQESAIMKIFNNLKSRPVDAEEVALLHNIHANNISGHLGRGYTILDTDETQKTVSLCEKCEYFDDARRPLWFVYSGMGSQWAGMGAPLMRIPIFAAAIERCHKVLKPKGLDIVDIITSPGKTMFDNILHSFVGIAAVQIGLTDILHELGLKPDGIIGHSVGELGCAYADGCLSAEEMILCAYSRGLVSLQTPLIRGSMAAVGLGYEQIYKMCPPEIDVACRNGPDSSTISGPADIIREFVTQLTAQSVFAKEVPCSNIAYHSRYIADAGPGLLKYLEEVIKNPKPRSDRWLSSSVPQAKWNQDFAKYCSAEYHTNNLLNPVLFDETCRLVPSGAVLVEVAPHGLLQAILKRSMSADCQHVPLTRRAHPDNALFLLQAVGNLYMHGYTPKVQVLYPKVQFPVSTGTPMLSHFVEWVHNETWTVASFVSGQTKMAASCKFVQSIHDDEHSYLRGHVVREKLCYPFAAALVAVWDTLAMHSGVGRGQMSVQFRDVHLYAQPTLHDQRALRLSVALHRGNGRFEILNKNFKVASGYIFGNVIEVTNELKKKHEQSSDIVLTSQDIYQLLRERDYTYSGEFLSIEAASASLSEAALVWRGNWVTLIDGMLQLNALRQSHDGVSLPTYIRRLCINVKEHTNNHYYQLNGKTVMQANVVDLHDFTKCGGILLQNIKFRNLPPIKEVLDLIIPATYIGNANHTSTNGMLQVVGQKSAVKLKCSEIGNLESMHWVEAVPEESSDITITVHYAGLSMHDVKKAGGMIPSASDAYGMDFSGTTQSGDRVMGLVQSGAASSVVRARPELLWPVPAHWSLEDAATVPLAYAHAFYCLIIKGKMKPGMKVLVHGGTGALGQAAIAIALAHQCQVFTTVSDVRKKIFLRKLYPQLKEEHIVSSRDGSFADFVLCATNSKGCDVVISCVKGGLKDLSLKCSGEFGFFVDTAQLQDNNNYEFGMFNLTLERSYVSSDFSSMFTQQRYEEINYLQRMLSEGISGGYVRPLSRVTYAPHDAARALRLLAASSHRGRVLLRLRDQVPPASPRVICNPDQWQLLFWDDGYLGVQLADRLVNRGARKLYIHATSITPYQQCKIESWRKLGAEIACTSADLKNVHTLINNVSRFGDIEGIYVVITKTCDDKNKYDEKLVDSLDSASRLLSPPIRYFLVVSTVSAVGQDTCLTRSQCGYTATSLDLSRSIPHTYHRDALDAAERAMCNGAPVQCARPARAHMLGLLEQLAAVAGIKIPQNTSLDTTLHELGIHGGNIPMICAFLNLKFNTSLEEYKIPLTLKGIHELADHATDIVPNNTTGLETLYRSIEADELLATSDLVELPTLNKDITLLKGEFNVNKRYLCIVPGMEGSHLRFHALCERLKLPALVLQPGLDYPRETVRETAERYAHILLNKTRIENNFYLLGYETGVLVVLEVAAILEDHGLTGTVFLVGCLPDDFQIILEEQLRDFETEEQLAMAVLRHIFKLLGGEDTVLLNDVLRHAASWSQKVDACVRALLGRVPYSAQYARALIEAALARIERARGYVPRAHALRSQLVLLRAADVPATPVPLPVRYSQRPVAVHQLRTPLSYLAYDMECPAIVNRFLDKDLLSEFENKNLCETYHIY